MKLYIVKLIGLKGMYDYLAFDINNEKYIIQDSSFTSYQEYYEFKPKAFKEL